MTKLYTSRFANPALSDPKLTKIRISRGFPKFRINYQVDDFAFILAPSRELFAIEDGDEFRRRYFEYLDQKGIEKVKAALRHCGYGTVETMVLLCFEDVRKEDEFCHRRDFADWWEQQTGEKIQEYPDPSPIKGITRIHIPQPTQDPQMKIIF